MSINFITRRGSDISQHVKRQFGDESLVQINESDIIRWIDDAQKALAGKMKLIKGRAAMLATPNQAEYVLPVENALQIESLHFDGKKVRGTTLSQAEQIMDQRDSAEQQVGEPLLWFSWGNTITFWPAPEEPKNITVYYTGTTPTFSDLTSLLSIPDQYYEAIVNYVMSKAYELDEEFNAASDQMQRYLNVLSDQTENAAEGQRLTYPMVTEIEGE